MYYLVNQRTITKFVIKGYISEDSSIGFMVAYVTTSDLDFGQNAETEITIEEIGKF